MYTKIPMELLNIKTGVQIISFGVTPCKVSTVQYKKRLSYKNSEGRLSMTPSTNFSHRPGYHQGLNYKHVEDSRQAG